MDFKSSQFDYKDFYNISLITLQNQICCKLLHIEGDCTCPEDFKVNIIDINVYCRCHTFTLQNQAFDEELWALMKKVLFANECRLSMTGSFIFC